MSEPQYILCPYCGHLQRTSERCSECGGLFEPLSRKATQIAMGPWYLRDKRLPFRPGCSFEVLKKQIQAGRVTQNTVLRGPTTRQFWAVARHVPGVAHLLGVCHKCGAKVEPTAKQCGACDAVFKEPSQRNELGLIFATAEAAREAQRELQEEVEALTAPLKPKAGSAPEAPAKAKRPGEDLLEEVLGAPQKPKAARSGAPAREGKDASSHGKAAPAANPAMPQALDFAPGPGQDAPAPRMSPTTVLLLTLNGVFLVLLALLLWMVSRG